MTPPQDNPRAGLAQRLTLCAREGLVKGLRTAIWLIAIMTPISLAVSLLQYWGLLAWLTPVLQPLFRHLGVPGEAVVACISAGALSVYSGIAVLITIPLTERQITILGMVILIAHNLPVESAIQHRAGTPMWRMWVLRIAAALAAGALLNLLLPAGTDAPRTRGVMESAAPGLGPFLGGWATGTALLGAKICAIVVGLMVLQGLLREFRVMDLLAIPLRPVLWMLGLPSRLAFLWIVANVLGLAYGAGIILEDVRSGRLSREDAQLLNRSVGICHSLLEDSLLLIAIGAWAFWITVPRLAMAAVAVWLYRAAKAVRKSKGLKPIE